MQIPAFASVIMDIIVALVLIFSFLGGLKNGAMKELFGLAAFIIALILAGLAQGLVAGWFSFIGDRAWRYLIAYLVALAIIMVILLLVLWLPRHLLDKVWSGGFIWSLVGGLLGALNAALGLTLLMRLLAVYEAWPWLSAVLASSRVIGWLVSVFGGFITSLMNLAQAPGIQASISSFVA